MEEIPSVSVIIRKDHIKNVWDTNKLNALFNVSERKII